MGDTQELNRQRATKISRKCFIPGCCSSMKRSLFSAPKDIVMFEKWKKALPSTKKLFTMKHSVCELHFEPHFVERYFKHVIQNEVILLERFRPRLDPNAVPTIFPSFPSHYSKHIPKKRSTRNSNKNSLITPHMPMKLINPTVRNINNELAVTKDDSRLHETSGPEVSIQIESVYTVLNTEFDVEDESQFLTAQKLQEFPLPSKYWSRHVAPNHENKVAFSCCSLEIEDKSICMTCDKLVTVTVECNTFTCNAYVQGVEVVGACTMKSMSELSEILKTVDGKHCCRGLGTFSQLSELHELFSKLKCYNNKLFHKDCKGEVDRRNGRCFDCGCLRRYLEVYHPKACKLNKPRFN